MLSHWQERQTEWLQSINKTAQLELYWLLVKLWVCVLKWYKVQVLMSDDQKHILRGVICLPLDLHSLVRGRHSHHRGWSIISFFRSCLSWLSAVFLLPCKGTRRPLLPLHVVWLHFSNGCHNDEWPSGRTWCGWGLHHPRGRIWSLNSIFLCLVFIWSLSLWIRGSAA